MKTLILLAGLLLIQGVAMCGLPITHAALAREWMALHGPKEERAVDEFIIGTLFPDIRYVTDDARSSTHVANVKLQDILAASTPFNAGKLLHCYVDEQREKWVVEWGVYDLLVDLPSSQRGSFLKLVEDEILYDRDHHEKLSSFFLFPQEELESGISMGALVKWHALLAGYFRTAPSGQLRDLKRLKQGVFHVSPEVVAAWADALPEVAQRPEMHRYVKRLVNAFKEEFASVGQRPLEGPR